ncbi:MAG: SUMF1/EgtB/PvdO family nonheme iron enzyme, partial [Bacteroidales bacterium]|nr:SUMF1/EgtB/PvdO family nonheme iron enzyme [Bacteroidales bacterium]
MKAKSFLTLISFCLLFLLPLSLCAQEPVCGKCLKKKSNCPYSCNHPTCKTCGKVCGAKNNACPYGGKHPKCSVCGKLKENCAYKGNHPKCTACGQLKENCTYRGDHPQCTTCGKLCGASSNACPYDGSHPKCNACGQVKDNCAYRGNHPQCSTCGKLCGASSNACPYGGKHPKPSVAYEGRDKVYTIDGVKFKMIAVAGGTFTMGATSEQQYPFDDEKPTHTVTLSEYYIGETEVTQELWAAVMGDNPSWFTGNIQRPVENVSWDDCQTFIRKLNELTGA